MEEMNHATTIHDKQKTVAVVEEATPKISNRAILLDDQETITLPPPIMQEQRQPRFSSFEEVPIQMRRRIRINNNNNNNNNNESSSSSRRTILTNLRNEEAILSPWMSWMLSFVFLWSKPFLSIVVQQFLYPRRKHLTSYFAREHPPSPPSSSNEVKGLRNYGQTCYLNTVLQSLASLESFQLYLQQLVEWNQQRYEPTQESLTARLWHVLQYLHSSSVEPPDVRDILQQVAHHHAPFRTAGPIGKHPQDAEELLQILMNCLGKEAEEWTTFRPLEWDDDTVVSSLSASTKKTHPEDGIIRRFPLKGEEKKQDEMEFDVFIPRIDSEEDMEMMHTKDDKEQEEKVTSSIHSFSTAMRHMRSTPSASPMSCWVGSALKCRTCQHRRPIHNTPIHSIPVVPLEVSQSLQPSRVEKSFTNQHIPPCRLEECLAEFAAVEVVQDVECRSCTIQEKKTELLEDIIMFQQAMESQSSKRGSEDVHHLQHELDQATAKLRAIYSIDPDDDAPLEDVLCSEEFYWYNDSIPIRRGTALKRMLLTRLPAVLTIHVQRRYYDPSTNRMTKTSQHVVFPEVLDVAPYCAHGGISFAEGFLSPERCRPIPYRLSSVIEHQGNAFYGHY
ncbi:ubiquitin carboxyl-terminal hydrolase 1 [Fistulifera solaris]|uniref:ubiquitinyl hydrolase 1 n=1 Tax=Fistulifera solaris TaxID=1519565 RepID=A0A1Z5JGL9_FISSO|nr:ubiquitin carboxyl-terminal hydrolase 1 [Fistulifera solaris]|eukprot:GAX12918.1 ubiquitin carboxyl-terminal hydrolase 1 [Fistulifera solaris]